MSKVNEREKSKNVSLIPVFFYGKQYDVPASFTIMQAFEYAGHQYTRGCGCRGGACGACSSLFFIPGSPQLKTGLACQTQVVPGMTIIQLPYFPTEKPGYNIEELSAEAASLGKIYPKLYKCLQCNTCTKMCPQEIDVMHCMAFSMRGDIVKVAVQSIPCVMCGLCASRCPAEIAPYHILLLARRLYGRYLLPRSNNVLSRLKEIEGGKFTGEIDAMMGFPTDQLKKMYEQQQADKRII